MAHLEMLIAKSEIRGPPYVMSDEQEFPFLRKFIERQRAGIPHNPRLRNEHQPQFSVGVHRSETPEDSRPSTSFVDDPARLLGPSFLSSECYRKTTPTPDRLSQMKTIMALPQTSLPNQVLAPVSPHGIRTSWLAVRNPLLPFKYLFP